MYHNERARVNGQGGNGMARVKTEGKKKHRVLRIIGILLLVGVIILALSLILSSRERKAQQALMVKSDAELIGEHLYLPREGGEDVDVNFYSVQDGAAHPLVINLHGGAFIAGDADTLDTQSDRISKAWNVHVATVNYHLAVDGYDIAYGTQEVVDVVKYFRQNAAEYGIEPDRIFVLGYSAGGYHAMASVLALHREGIDVAGQIICYGFIKEINETYLALDETVRRSIAPALFILADNDPISEGSLLYRQSLEENGVKTEVQTYDGALHGFIEENNPEYAVLKTTSRSSAQETMARAAEDVIGAWILAHCGA